MPDLDDERKIMDVKRARIHHVVQRVGTEFEYVYDFGDDWEHDLLLEAIPATGSEYPVSTLHRRRTQLSARGRRRIGRV